MPVRFSGHGAGDGELSWGQKTIWRTMRESRSSITQGLASPVPPGFTAEDMAAEVRFIMNRYPAFRTRLRFGADGATRQVVEAEGEIAMEVVDLEAGEDPAAVAGAVRDRYTSTLFDYTTEFPVRVALIRRDGVLSHVVRAFCHFASDGMGFARMGSEVFHPDRAALPAPTSVDALEQALWQQSGAGSQQSEKSLKYWENLLLKLPADRFPEAVREGASRGRWQIEFESPAMELSMRAVAERTGVPSSVVLLTSFLLSLSRMTGVDPVATRVLVSNRFRSGLAETVSPIAQYGLLVVELGGVPFPEAIARTQRAVMATYKHAYYDPERLRDLVTRVCRERGELIDLACLFNDRRIEARDRPAASPAKLAPTTLRWAFPTPNLNEKLLMMVNDRPGTISISAMVDTDHVAPQQAEALLHGMQDLLAGAAQGADGILDGHPEQPAGPQV